jgi:DNA helicase II / ATP-dependent DNA helicase PcrA
MPRPAQQQILEYTSGPMGISAVPGSGKTFTLSLLAAHLVERLATSGTMDEQEVLVVTFTNSAVENFRSRIGLFLRLQRGLLPGVGYRVRTLHGLAHDIVRERPALVGLSEDFDIIDERTAQEIKRDAVVTYLRANPDAFSPYIQPEFLQNPRRIERRLLEDAIDIANIMIRTAKEERMEAHRFGALLEQQRGLWPLLDFGLRIYADYQRALMLRGAVDFDDLIILALQALEADPDYLARLQARWPYVLEDEAQDSSRLQEIMLRQLTAAHGNWVRVGDPNQAINTTFTSADTRYLRNFIAQHAEQSRNLPNSGRSARRIIDLANYLNGWSHSAHPYLPPEMALSAPLIEPTPPGDPQPNPEPGERGIYIYPRAQTPAQELDAVIISLRRWLPEHPDETVAVLAPDNSRCFQLTSLLESAELPFDDSLLRTDSNTRAGARALATVLNYVAHPHQVNHLKNVWTDVWWPRRGPMVQPELGNGATPPPETVRPSGRKVELPEPVLQFGQELARLRQPEQFVFPNRRDWLDSLDWLEEVAGLRPYLEAFRADLQRWTRAAILPVDELLITLGNDLFSEPIDLALTHRLAVLLARLGVENPSWRLGELAGELEGIAQNRRRIMGFNEDATGFEPEPGRVTVATLHGAKGLEWDRVYLMSVNSYSFPSGSEEESYRSESFYVRDRLNLLAEAQAQLTLLHAGALDDYVPGKATQRARLDMAAERLRLLYVGITRARKELIIMYNTGRKSETDPLEPALAFEALYNMMAAP